MRAAIKREFGNQKPQAIVLDDSAGARLMTARQLRNRGFAVTACANLEEFVDAWNPGRVDVIISDWDLSHQYGGEEILEEVRARDWDVPFVLVSGKLGQAQQRAGVLEQLLANGGARFVERGGTGIHDACDLAEEMIERRDLTLLKMILALRPAAVSGAVIQTSSGEVSAQDILSDLVSKPKASHEAIRPIAKARSQRTDYAG